MCICYVYSMSKKIYDYNTCYEIAKNYTYSSEFQKGNGSAYNVARKNGWIKDYTWFVKKQHDVYTYEECYEIAKDYDCVSEFQKGNGSVYAKARERGWLKDYTWFKPRSRKPYTYEECYEIAKKYDTRTKYCKGNIGAYQASLNHGWLDDYTWFHYVQRPTGYWTKEKVIEESKKYKTRGEFHDYNGTAYSKARTNGWLDEMVWLKDDRIDFSTDKVDCVYAYEFVDFNSVYIGRTLFRRVNERDKEHLFNDRDTVSKFCRKKDIHIPVIKILENDLTLAEGVEKEGYYVEKYKQEGWNILNKAKTGSIGLIAKNKWTKKTCYEEARKYKTKMEFYKGSGGCYDAARRSGWLKDYTWFEEKQKPKGYWDNYENCYNAAKECKTISEFVHRYNRAYLISKKNNWLKDYVWFPKNKKDSEDPVCLLF